MKRSLCLFLFAAMLFAVFSVPVTATGSEPAGEESIYGWLILQADVPEGFEKAVCVSLTDSQENTEVYRLQKKDQYTRIVRIPYGTYQVAAYVSGDTQSEYIVLMEQLTLKMEEEEMEFPLLVSKLPTGNTSDATEPSSKPTDPSESILPTPTGTDGAGSQQPSQPEAPGDETGPSADPSEPSEDPDTAPVENPKKSWSDVLISLIGTAAFVGVTYLFAYFFRKYKDRF